VSALSLRVESTDSMMKLSSEQNVKQGLGLILIFVFGSYCEMVLR